VVYHEQQIHERSEVQLLTRENLVRNWAIQFSGGEPTVRDDLLAIIRTARDLERVQRCGIHYATPDGRVIPFCSYNSLHREEVERRFSVPLEGWARSHVDP